MPASKAHRSFMTLIQRALQDWSQFSSVCGNTQGYFGKPLTDSFLFDTDAQALSQTYLEGITVLLQSTKCAILGLSSNSKAFRRLWSAIEQWSIQLSDIIHAHDSHYLDDATVWTVLEKLQELVYNLLRGGVKYARDSIYQGPQMLVTSQLYLKVIQSHHPNIRRLRFLLELSLIRYTEVVTLSRLPRTEFYPFTKTSRETIMDCFRRSITRIQDPTITFEDRLHIHTFVLVVSRSSLKYSRVLLANRALYWLCTSLSCFPSMLAANPGKYGDEVLGLCLAYLADQFNLSGPEYMSEALDADILDTMLKLDKLFPGAYDVFIGMLDSIHKGLIFRGVERRVRKTLDKIDQHSLDADLQPGAIKDSWFDMKSRAQSVHAYKIYYHTLDCDDELRCSNCQCPKAYVGRHPKRCTGCWITLYCSRACQKAAWKGHREQCHKWAQGRKDGIAGPFGDHDLFYIRRYVLEELKASARHVRDLKRAHLKSHPDIPVRRLVINYDYNKLPWSFQIILPEDIKERAGVMTPELFGPSDEGKAQLVRLVTPWKGEPAAMVLHILYTPDYPSDEHLFIRGL